MPFRAKCPACGTTLTIPDEKRGKAFACLSCGKAYKFGAARKAQAADESPAVDLAEADDSEAVFGAPDAAEAPRPKKRFVRRASEDDDEDEAPRKPARPRRPVRADSTAAGLWGVGILLGALFLICAGGAGIFALLVSFQKSP